MRKNRENQLPLNPIWPEHRLADELRAISRILDDNPRIPELVLHDVSDKIDPGVGAPGLSGEQIVRCAILKQLHGLSYQKLSFHLLDSMSFRQFCRLPAGVTPGKSCLQDNISRVGEGTWREINDCLVGWARAEGLEKGDRIRADSTAVACTVKHPLDSDLLWDSVRAMTRELERLRGMGRKVVFSDHRRRAKRRVTNIRNSRGAKRLAHYKDLLKVTRRTLGYARAAVAASRRWRSPAPLAAAARLERFLSLAARVVDQTERRLLRGEKVPAADKVVSIFEDHADIVKKSNGDPVFGHKIFLTEGKSKLVLDCVVRRGNPADQREFKDLMTRHAARYGRFPRQTSLDGGFASRDNLDWAKRQNGVRDVAFAKKCGLKVSEMVSSTWIYRQLRRFRAGIESCISFLKRCLGLFRCTWKGWPRFQRYIQLSVVGYNLLVLARLKL